MQASSDPLLQKPVARPAAPAEGAAAAPAAAAPAAAASSEPSGVTIEYQRQQAKAMRQYFQNLKLAETVERSKCVVVVMGLGFLHMGLALAICHEAALSLHFSRLHPSPMHAGLPDVWELFALRLPWKNCLQQGCNCHACWLFALATVGLPF